jgi:hypothetical protein
VIGLEEDNFINFRARVAEFREQPQVRASKRAIFTADLEETKRQKKDEPILHQPKLPLSALIGMEDVLRSSHSEPSLQTRLEWDNTSAVEAIQRILDRAKKGKSEQGSPKAQAEDLTTSAVQSVLDQYQGKRLHRTSSEEFPRSPTEPLSDNKPVSKGSLASRSKSPLFSEDSNALS